MPSFVLAFALSFTATLVLTPLVRAVARRYSIIAQPRRDRWHSQPTALLGGAAIWAGAIIGIVTMGRRTLAFDLRAIDHQTLGIIAASTLLFVVGLVDDFRRLTPPVKLLLQSVAAAIVLSSGIVYSATSSATVNVVFTLFWVIAVTNSLNLLDNLDGVASGVAGLAALFLSINFALSGAIGLSLVSASLAGAAFGFVPYNFAPASIFMGDSGSLFLGVVLASLSAAYPAHNARLVVPVLLVPVLTVVVPIVDTALVTVLRKLAGRRISLGGRDHTSHRLVAMGLRESEVALLFYGVATIGGALGLWMARDRSDAATVAAAVFLAGLAVTVRFLARMHTYEADEAPRAGRVTFLISDLLHKRRSVEMLIDLLLLGIAYHAVFMTPLARAVTSVRGAGFIAVVIIAKIAAMSRAGVYRSEWDRSPSEEMRMVVRALALVSVAAGVIAVTMTRGVLVIEILFSDLVISALLCTGARGMYFGLERAHEMLRIARNPLVTSAQE